MLLGESGRNGVIHRERTHPNKQIINAASAAQTAPQIDPPRLYMNGPSKSDIKKPEEHFDWMEGGIVFAGVSHMLMNERR